MNVEIDGSVRAGFTVKSAGTVLIAGVVENGATIDAKGDVVVAKGIFGESTSVTALGNVETKLIQNSTVLRRPCRRRVRRSSPPWEPHSRVDLV